jgi:outer membrane receptor protein involved in Fe transport
MEGALKRFSKQLTRMAASASILALAAWPCAAAAQLDPAAPPDAEQPAPAPQAQEPAPPSDSGAIVITGSRAIRDGFQAPNPVSVVSQEDLDLVAPTNIADTINEFPSVSGSMTPQVGNVGTSGGTAGLNVLNLRNLGVGRTLVLMDGRRLVPSRSNGLVDINTIPAQLVKRVDIVTGGVSSAYGSDAVAGVVNFVLDTRFTGIKAEAQMGITTRGDGRTSKLAATYGTQFSDGRGHFLLSSEYNRQKLIDGAAHTRGWYKGTKLVPNPAGTPTLIYADDVNIANATFGGLILDTPANGPVGGTMFGAGGVPLPWERGAPTGNPLMMIGGTSADLAGETPLRADVENFNAYSRLSFEVAPSVDLFAEGGYSTSRVLNPAVNPFYLGSLTLQQDNAFLPAEIRQAMAGAGLTSVSFGTLNGDIGKILADIKSKTYRFTAGFDAKLGGSWSVDGYYQFGRSDVTNRLRNQVIKSRYLQAIDAVEDGSGNIVCRDSSGGCIPLDVIGLGVASPAAIDWVTGTVRRDSKIDQNVIALNVRGEPFSTWAAPVTLALGAEYRKDKVAETVDALSLQSAFFSGNFQPIDGKVTVKEAFGEVVVPLARDLPFARSLDLNGAIRFTNYSTTGSVSTWKIGATWKPVDDLLFRGVRSRDIRAPNLAELFGGNQFTQTVSNPFRSGETNTVAAFVGSANPNLQPEESDAYVLGAVYTPAWLPGAGISIDYYNFEVKGAISNLAPNIQVVVNQCFASMGQSSICDNIVFANDMSITAVSVPLVNAGELKTSGFEIQASHNFRLGGEESLRVSASVNHVNEFRVTTSATSVDTAGELSGANGAAVPDWQARASAIYSNHGFQAGLIGRFIGSGKFSNTFGPGDIADNSIPAVVYVDATIGKKLVDMKGEPELFFYVENLFDRRPPVIGQTGSLIFLQQGFNPALYDPVGRSIRGGLRVRF